MTDISGIRPTTQRPAAAVAVGIALAAAAAVVLNALVALLAGQIVPDDGARKGLAPLEYIPLTVIGVLLGTLGWYLVRRRARDPRAVLRVLVPVVVVVSFVPDFGIMAAGASLTNSLALIVMHVVVALVTVPTLARVLPLPPTSG